MEAVRRWAAVASPPTSLMVGTWRLLVTEPLDGPMNMAIDEALLRSRIAEDSPPTIRFYAWTSPTVSLGYAQSPDDGIDLAYCARMGIGLVRRPTGGSAILHGPQDHELTYSVVARAGDFRGADDVLETYRILSSGLAAGFARLGVAVEVVSLVRARRGTATAPFCFSRTGAYEIAVSGKKLVGSAQRRQAGAFLQHGSVLLAADDERVRGVFAGVRSPLDGTTTLTAVLGRSIAFDDVVSRLAAGFGDVLGVPLVPAELSSREVELGERLVAEKYATQGWTLQPVSGSRVSPASRSPSGSPAA